MANTFRLKRSSVASKVPTTGDLQLGELALNTYDGKLYTKKDNGTASIVEIGAAGGISDGDKGDITVSGSGATWTLDPSGVTAGTYNNSATAITPFTVDAKGRITATGAGVTVTPAFSSITGKPTTLSGYGITDAPTTTGTGASGTWGINVTGSSASCTGNAATATTASNVAATADQGVVNQENGNSAAWRGRILSKNSTADKAAFLGTYGSIAGVFAHNNALNAWADLYVNTVDGSGGGTVRMPTSLLLGGNQALHAGNYTSYSPSLTGSGASGTWSINVSGSAGYLAGFGIATDLNVQNTTGCYGWAPSTANKPPDGYGQIIGIINSGTQQDNASNWLTQLGFGTSTNTAYFRTKVNSGGWGSWYTLIHSGNYTSYSPSLTGSGASGTWSINVTGSSGSCSGNAATATKLSTAGGSAPSYSARAWVRFNGTGAVAINAQANVTSISDNGVGDYTVNFSTGMPSSDYVVTMNNGRTGLNTTLLSCCRLANELTAPTASSVRVSHGVPTSSRDFQREDVSIMMVSIFA